MELNLNNLGGSKKSKRSSKSKDTPKRFVAGPSLQNPGSWVPEDPNQRKKEIIALKAARTFENYWLPLLNEAMDKRDYHKLEVLFIEWGIKKGFQEKYLMDWAQKDYLNFGLIIYNVYLELIPGCHTRFRQSRFKSKIPKTFLLGKSPEFIKQIELFQESIQNDMKGGL